MEKTSDQIPSQFKMKLQGKEHVTFDGLIDLAHKNGLGGTETVVVQFPNEENKWTAVVKAVVTLIDSTGQYRNFSGIGDANPANTNKAIALHSIRMAETRAIGRALRVALNIKGCMYEELGGDAKGEPVGDEPSSEPADDSADPISGKAKTAVGAELKRIGWETTHALNWVNKNAPGESKAANAGALTMSQARALMKHIKGLPDASDDAA
jgi:hypothetical protein